MRAAWEAEGCERCCARHKVLSTAVRRVLRSVLGRLKERPEGGRGPYQRPGLAPIKARPGVGFHPTHRSMKEQHSPPPTARQQPSALSLSLPIARTLASERRAAPPATQTRPHLAFMSQNAQSLDRCVRKLDELWQSRCRVHVSAARPAGKRRTALCVSRC